MNKVEIYTVDYCPYCKKAKDLLTSLDIPFSEIDITQDEDELRGKLAEMYAIEGKVTVPQIIIGEKRIGGYDSLKKLIAEDKLNSFLDN